MFNSFKSDFQLQRLTVYSSFLNESVFKIDYLWQLKNHTSSLDKNGHKKNPDYKL
jgi:hypothetical protein